MRGELPLAHPLGHVEQRAGQHVRGLGAAEPLPVFCLWQGFEARQLCLPCRWRIGLSFGSYIKDGWNAFDFTIVMTSLLDLGELRATS